MENSGILPYGILASELKREDAEQIQETITKTFFPGIPEEEYKESPRVHLTLAHRYPNLATIQKATDELNSKNLEAVVIYNPEASGLLFKCSKLLAEQNPGLYVLYYDVYASDQNRPENTPENMRFIQVLDRNIQVLSENITTALLELTVSSVHAKTASSAHEQSSPPYGTPAD